MGARIRRGLTVIGLGSVTTYGLAMLAALVLAGVLRESEFGVYAMTCLYLPSLLALPLAIMLLLARRRRLLLVLLPAVITTLIIHAPYFLPQTVTASPTALRLRVATYNLHAETREIAPLLRVIRALDADVIALQEMSEAAAESIERELEAEYPTRLLYPGVGEERYWGRGLLSRYPVLSEESLPLIFPLPTRLQWATLDIAGQPVVIYNFHAPPNVPIFGQPVDLEPRRDQIADLLVRAGQHEGPVLLLGDFNTHDLDANYAAISQTYRDAYREVGWGLGYTNPENSYPQARESPLWLPPYQRIDYIFFNRWFIALEAQVWPDSGGSDHLPLWATLALPS